MSPYCVYRRMRINWLYLDIKFLMWTSVIGSQDDRLQGDGVPVFTYHIETQPGHCADKALDSHCRTEAQHLCLCSQERGFISSKFPSLKYSISQIYVYLMILDLFFFFFSNKCLVITPQTLYGSPHKSHMYLPHMFYSGFGTCLPSLPVELDKYLGNTPAQRDAKNYNHIGFSIGTLSRYIKFLYLL